MVLPGRDDLTYVLLVKIGSLVLTTLLVMITCLRCVGRIRLRVTAGFWRPDCYKNSRQCREADEVDASNHTSSRNVASVSRSRPLSDFVPFSRISRPPTLERSRSNSEIYAYVGKHQNLGHYWQNVGSNPMQYDMPAYSQILENDGQSSDDLYCQMHGHEFYDNIMDVNSNSERPSKVAANSYDYPKFSPLPLKARPTGADSSEPKQGATDSGCFEPHLYCAIRSISDLHAKPEPSSVPLHRSRLSHSHIGICAEPLYSVIRKQMPFTGRTVYVSRRMLPYSEPSIVQIGVVDASNGPDSSFNPPIEVGPTRERENAEEVFSSNNYRYLSMREPLDVLRRRLEQQDSRNLFNSASDSSLHYYTSINESSDPGYEAQWWQRWCHRIGGWTVERSFERTAADRSAIKFGKSGIVSQKCVQFNSGPLDAFISGMFGGTALARLECWRGDVVERLGLVHGIRWISFGERRAKKVVAGSVIFKKLVQAFHFLKNCSQSVMLI
uniref:Uncharacterized protein n=1 Tax=Trichuris muris TaxID=70415 RepID=A0A5S6QYU7_TRIMR